MLKILYFYTNTQPETLALLITCVTDDTDGKKCSSRSTKFMMSMNWKQRLVDVWHGFEQSVINV